MAKGHPEEKYNQNGQLVRKPITVDNAKNSMRTLHVSNHQQETSTKL